MKKIKIKHTYIWHVELTLGDSGTHRIPVVVDMYQHSYLEKGKNK